MDITGIDELDDLLILFTNDGFVNVKDEVISPENFVFHQHYPNPFNSITKIRYSVPSLGAYRNTPIQLKIHDVLGNEITTLVNEALPAGKYKVEFDSRATHPIALTSGIYFYRLKAGESFIDVKKMILMK